MARKSPPPPEPIEDSPLPARPAWRRVFQPWTLVRLALLAALGLAIPRLGQLLPDLGRRPEYHVGPEQVSITPPPRWVAGDIVREVFEASQLPDTLSLVDDGLNGRLAEAFRRHAWVAEVRGVRKSFPASVMLDLEYRRPVAMVQVPQGLYPVDARGILLPPADFSPEVAREYPLILGIRSNPQRGPGTEWGDPAVHNAARLAQALAPRWQPLKLEAILCPKLGDARDEPYVLISGGSRILWGRPPGADDPGEPTTTQKIGRLDKYIADCGGFNLPRGPYEIDIRHFREISRRQLLPRSIEGTQAPTRERR